MDGMSSIYHKSVGKCFLKMRFATIKPFHLYRQKIIYDVAQIFLRNSWQGIDIPFFSLWCSILYYLSSPTFITSTSGYRINNLASWQRYFLWTTSDANTTPGDRINVKGSMVLEASYLSLTQVGSSVHVLWGSNSVKCASVSHSHSQIASEKYLQDHKIDNIIHRSCLIDSHDHFWFLYCHITVIVTFTERSLIIFLNRTTFIHLICGFTSEQSTVAVDCLSWRQTSTFHYLIIETMSKTDSSVTHVERNEKWILNTVYSFALGPGFITASSERK